MYCTTKDVFWDPPLLTHLCLCSLSSLPLLDWSFSKGGKRACRSWANLIGGKGHCLSHCFSLARWETGLMEWKLSGDHYFSLTSDLLGVFLFLVLLEDGLCVNVFCVQEEQWKHTAVMRWNLTVSRISLFDTSRPLSSIPSVILPHSVPAGLTGVRWLILAYVPSRDCQTHSLIQAEQVHSPSPCRHLRKHYPPLYSHIQWLLFQSSLLRWTVFSPAVLGLSLTRPRFLKFRQQYVIVCVRACGGLIVM